MDRDQEMIFWSLSGSQAFMKRMSDSELKKIKNDLESIKKALGIGLTGPANVMDIRRRAAEDADRLKKRH